jgi:hypothetical protein
MNSYWKGCEIIMAEIEVLLLHLPGGSEENYKHRL